MGAGQDGRQDSGQVRQREQPGRAAQVPDGPTGLPRRSWCAVLRRAVREFSADNLSDRAAALTYYAVLAVFPGLLVIVALLGLVSPTAIDSAVNELRTVVPGQAHDILQGAIDELQANRTGAGLAAVLGIGGAVWSASGYVGGFIRAANVVYDVPEGRPWWRTIPLRLVVTVALLVTMSSAAVLVVVSGSIARTVGELIGVGDTGVLIWRFAKWPVLLVLLMAVIALLYWACPNVRHPGWRWVTPGGVFGALLWVVASAGFALYVSTVGSYNATYGALAGGITFLVWIWVSNLALLLGAEIDAELARARAERAGMPPGHEPYLAMREAPDPGHAGRAGTRA